MIRQSLMTPDQYFQSQLQPLLQPGEQVLQTAYMRRQPGLLMQMLLVGGLLLYLITKVYFVALTNRRLILVRTKMGLFGGPKQLNLSLEEHDVRNLREVTTSGFANNRSMTFHMHQGEAQTLRISPWGKAIIGTKQFLEQVPVMVGSGQLAQMAMGAPPPQAQLPVPAPQAQLMPQNPMGAPMLQGGPPTVFQPGQPVLVATPDGNQYAGTIMQFANGQYMCQMPNGQGHWFPAQAVTPRG